MGLPLLATGCAPDPPAEPPSILLVVIDTLRADAVSAYGEAAGTTPALDALAAVGQRYTRAYAPAPWTLPSHASLLSGLAVASHGVGLGGRVVLPGEIETLAERLRGEGYQTAAFSENALVSGAFGFDQGFDHFAVRTAEDQLAAGRKLMIDVETEVAAWLEGRDPERPFFIFVNLYDPHEPYAVRAANPFLPGETTTADAQRLGAGRRTSHLICDRIPSAGELEILHGLYLGDVAAADAKLGNVLELLDARGIANLVTVVTSDHGEHFGERRLLDHEFSVEEEVLRVPLVVRRPGVAPATVEHPVELRDIARSLLDWAGADSPEADGAQGLEPSDPETARSLFALYSDTRMRLPRVMDPEAAHAMKDFKREGCGAADRVFGDMVAVTRYPFRLHWYARYPAELRDLRAAKTNPEETAMRFPQAFSALGDAARHFAKNAGLGTATPPVPVSEENEETLRSLGYLE